MKKLTAKLLLLFLSFVMMSSTVFADGALPTAGENVPFPDISAQSYVLADAKTGEIIFSHNENTRLPIASTTKVMTCLVALENSNLGDVVTVTADSVGIEGSSIYLYENEKLTMKDLLYGLMLESANDCAACIAYHVAGSVEAFADMMNERAKALNAVNTHFNNPHGLEDPEHYSTAGDMMLIWNEAMKNSDFRTIVSTETYRIDMEGDKGYRFLSNHNKLLKSFEPCIGGKTGFTKTAGRCLISGAQQDSVELVMVTLNAPNDWDDHKSLIKYALSLYTTVEVATDSTVMHTLPVVGGVSGTVNLKNKDPLKLTLRDITKLEASLHSPRFVYAPVIDTQRPLAEIVYSVNGKEVASLPLYPEEAIEQAPRSNFFQRLLNIFK